MKRIFTFIVASFMAAVACTTDTDFEVSAPEEQLVDVTIVAEGSEDTRLLLNGDATAWEIGDKLNVMLTDGATSKYAIFSIDKLEENGKYARFTGQVPEGTYTRVEAFYPGADTATAQLFVGAQSADNIFLGGTVDYSDSPLVVKADSKPVVPIVFEHLMHKIDYKLSYASGYTSNDLSSDNVVVEMVVEEGGAKRDIMQCSNYIMANGALSSSLATAKSHYANLLGCDFSSAASALVFPMDMSDVALTFNVYVDGEHKHTIRKPGTGTYSKLTMTAGRSTSVKLALSEDTEVKAAAGSGSSGGGIVSDFNPDYYIKTFMSGVSGVLTNYGVGFRAYVENTYIDIHIASSYSTTSSIETGSYTWKGTSFMSQSERHFSVRNGSGLYALGLKSSTTLDSGSMEVAKSGNVYIIDCTLTDTNNKTIKIQYIGELNVENGGQTSAGSGSGSGGEAVSNDITLTSLTAGDYTNNYYTYTATDNAGNSLKLYLNDSLAANTSLNAGFAEYIVKGYAGKEGYFHADNITIGSSAKSGVEAGMINVIKGGSSVEFSVNLTFSDGTTQRFVYGGTIASNGSSGGGEVVEKELVLTTSKTNITADNTDYAYLSVAEDGVDVTDQCTYYANGSRLSYNWLQTATAGTYTIYAMKDGVKSNEVTVTATAPVVTSITLSADRTSIRANGSDTATFAVVDNNGTTVTSSCTFYVNSVNNNGNTFATTSVGSYSVYAKYNGLTSNTLTVTATATTSDTTIVWAEGVTKNSGWYDCNKIGNPTAGSGNGDSMMCWAASSANIIEWWQDRYKAAGKSLPSTAITGKGTTVYQGVRTYELALMEMFYTQWGNHNNGSSPLAAIPWYFEGEDYDKTTSTDYRDYPLTSGGYWSSVWISISPYLYKGYDYLGLYSDLYVGEIYGYSTWETSGGLSLFTQYMDDAFSKGIVSMVAGVDSKNGAQHAVTLWGYEKDNTTGKITRMWITDSDDALYDAEPRTPTLNEYNVTEDGNCVVLSGSTRYTLWIRKYYPVSKYGSN